jgi:hypothetical protein
METGKGVVDTHPAHERAIRVFNRSRTRRYAAALVGCLAAVLVAAPAAWATFEPRLIVSADGGSATAVYTQAAWQDAPAVLSFYAPPAYKAGLGATSGGVVGSARVQVVSPAQSNSAAVLSGTIRVVAPVTPLTAADGDASTVGAVAEACTGSKTFAALWLVSVKASGRTLDLAAAVQVGEDEPLAGRLAVSICPPAPTTEDPAGDLKIVRLTLTLSNVFKIPTGTHVWQLRATPYGEGRDMPNWASSVKASAQHTGPHKLTLQAKAAGSKRVRLSGLLTVEGTGTPDQAVLLYANGKLVRTVKTTDAGAFAVTVARPRRQPTFTARARVSAQYLDACLETTVFASLRCTASIVSGFTATSRSVRVTG